MEELARRRSAGRRTSTARRTAGRDARRGIEVDRRRLIQLAVSVGLFLLVYIGRGVFPAQLQRWQERIAQDVDFQAAFQRFGAALSRGEPAWDAAEELCAALTGREAETPSPEPEPKPSFSGEPVLLSGTPAGGMAYLSAHRLPGEYEALLARAAPGPDAGQGEPESARPEPEPEPDPTPEVVTAVAQAYTDDGVELPRNVSLAYYNLGLSETTVPVQGTVTSGFGYRDSPVNGENEFHLALDIGAAEGTEIRAFAAGTVEYIGKSDEFGNYLKIRHANNSASFYAHCSKLLVHKGDEVACGQAVALVGHTGNATGPHLHLTIEKDGIRLDPAYYVDLS